MEREQFTFYRSYYEALKKLSKRDREQAIMAICAYALDEQSLPLTGGAAVMFLLVKPTLDSGRRKAASGKRGGSKPEGTPKQTESKPEANVKQTGKEIEGEIEIEKEIEKEVEVENECCDPPAPLPPPPEADIASAVLADYLDRINPAASPASLDELRGYAGELGEAVCKRAFDIALDSKKATWPYIRAILRDKQARGVRCLADWDALEARKGPQPTVGDNAWMKELIDRRRGDDV